MCLQNIYTDFFTHVPTEHIVCMPLHLRTHKKPIHICMHTDTGMQRVFTHSNSKGALAHSAQGIA